MPRNPVGEFNTRGQGKCPHCSDWKPEAWIDSHTQSCPQNPENKPATGNDSATTPDNAKG